MSFIIGILIGMVFLTAFACVCYQAYSVGQDNIFIWQKSIKHIVFGGIIVFLGLYFVIFIIGQNQWVYFWDNSGYWTLSVQQMNRLFDNPLLALKELYISINQNDYNLLLPTIISVPMKLFGYEYVNYVTINYVLFLTPACVALTGCCTIILKKLEIKTSQFTWVGIFVFAMTFPISYYGMFLGYVDVAELLPSALLLLLSLDYHPTIFNKASLKKDILMALLLVTVLLFRRYFAYYIVGFVAALLGKAICAGVDDYRNNYNIIVSLKNIIINFIIIGGIPLLIFLLFFRQFLFHALFTNYAGQYMAYDDLFGVKLKNVILSFGYLIVFFIILSGIMCFVCKKCRTIFLFLLVSVLVTVVAFFRVQGMGAHHHYVISNQLFLLEFICVAILAANWKRVISKVICVMVILLHTLNFGYCYLPEVRNHINISSNIWATSYYPMKRSDLNTLHKMGNYLNQLTNGSNHMIYITASGVVLNSDIICSLDKPYSFNAVDNLLQTADIDLRDGFPEAFLSADIIVATSPVELHAAEGTQEVVRFLNQEVLNENSPIGRHFSVDRIFLLDNNVKAIILIKNSSFQYEDLKYLADYYDSYYPNNKELFLYRILPQTM